jgi:DNA-binding FadR family transcriptional regulator
MTRVAKAALFVLGWTRPQTPRPMRQLTFENRRSSRSDLDRAESAKKPALSRLEDQGVLDRHTRRIGITAPTESKADLCDGADCAVAFVRSSLSIWMRCSCKPSRYLVMQMALPLTAERMKPALIAALERNMDQLASLPRTGSMSEHLSLGFEFYSLIAQAADNAVIQVIVESFTEILHRQVEKSKVGPLPDLIAHRRGLVSFLANGQIENATREMTDHLQRLHKYLIKEERLSLQQRASSPEEAVSTTASRQSKPPVAAAKR